MLLLTYSPAIAVLLILTSLYLSKSRFIKFKHWWGLNCVLLKNAKFKSFKIQNCRNFAEFRCREIYTPQNREKKRVTKTFSKWVACVADVRRGRKGERRACEARGRIEREVREACAILPRSFWSFPSPSTACRAGCVMSFQNSDLVPRFGGVN